MSIPGTYSKARPIGDLEVIWEEDTENVVVHDNGQTTRLMIGIIPLDKFPMLKQGYACAQCFTILNMAFPENCPTCNFPMKERQSEYLARNYVGNMRTGPTRTLEDEKLIMQEMRQREAQRLGIWTPPRRYHT